MANFQTSGLNYWETVEDRWVYTARRFTSIETYYNKQTARTQALSLRGCYVWKARTACANLQCDTSVLICHPTVRGHQSCPVPATVSISVQVAVVHKLPSFNYRF